MPINLRRPITLAWLLVSLTASVGPAPSEVGKPKASLALKGKLAFLSGTGPVLKAQGKDYRLAAKTSWLFHTLQDERLRNRHVRLEGSMRLDGTFEVERLSTVRNGKLYKTRYFCETCNVEALEPGNCVCCQQPTELQEVPVTESK